MHVEAPAKINLTLHVVGRRADGYHELRSLMVPISLYDRVSMRVLPAARNSVTCSVSGPERVPGGRNNLAARAALSLLEETGICARVELHLYKRIPAGAGLGGGSSDAAAVLRTLQRILGVRLQRTRLTGLGASLGADVPFFLGGRPAWASGIGEQLQVVKGLPRMALVVAVPRVRIATAWAFEHALGGLTSRKKVPTLAHLSLRDLAQGRGLHNDFESGVSSAEPEVGRVARRLTEVGARATVLSGTGSAVVGVFDDTKAAHEACRQFRAPDKAFAVDILRRAPALSM